MADTTPPKFRLYNPNEALASMLSDLDPATAADVIANADRMRMERREYRRASQWADVEPAQRAAVDSILTEIELVADLVAWFVNADIISEDSPGPLAERLLDELEAVLILKAGVRREAVRDHLDQVAPRSTMSRKPFVDRENVVRRLAERDGWDCRYCRTGLTNDWLHIDHVTPVAQGGTNDDANLALSCPPCNMSKGARTPEQWRAAK